jgi:hypothetical protein
LPYQRTDVQKKAILRCGGHSGRNVRRGGIVKRGSLGVGSQRALLGKKINPKPPEPTYVISSVGPYQRNEKIILEVSIQGRDGKKHRMTAMVDCGARENFVDKKYAETIQIPMDEKKVPRRVLAVDGREVTSGLVTHDTMVELIVNDHHEKIKLHCITIGNSPIIVGLPWLRKHNPTIDWKKGKVIFDLDNCARECLDTSPHARTVPEEEAIDRYHHDMARNAIIATTWEEEEQDEVHGKTTQDPCDQNDPIRTSPTENEVQKEPHEVSSTDTPTTPTSPENDKSSKRSARDTIPPEYHGYLHIFNERENRERPLHRHHDHRIPLLEGQVPPFEPLRALDEGRLKALREYIERSMKKAWIRSSTSPAGNPIHFVKKKDGGLRLCVDYRGLNAMTIKDQTPLPLIGEALHRLSKAKVYTKLDVKDAYHHLRIAKGDKWKTAFRTKYGLYQYLVMPFGLTNAPASFQRWMNEVLSDYLDIFCIAYLDDNLIYSDDIETHRKHVTMILKGVEEVSLTLKASKCEFRTDRTEYLGYIIAATGISMDPEKVKVVEEWREPTNVKGVQSFLGFANFYRRFIRDFSKITAALTKLTRNDRPWEWNDAAQVAFEQRKAAMISQPMLRHFDPTRPLTLEMDASDYTIGAVCSQPNDLGILHPLRYFS